MSWFHYASHHEMLMLLRKQYTNWFNDAVCSNVYVHVVWYCSSSACSVLVFEADQWCGCVCLLIAAFLSQCAWLSRVILLLWQEYCTLVVASYVYSCV